MPKHSLFSYFERGIKHEMSAAFKFISDKSVTVSVSDGSSATLAIDCIAARRMDHKHALTGHDNQGEIADSIIVAIGANEHLADQTSFYVGISRARDHATLVTADAKLLAKKLRSKLAKR